MARFSYSRNDMNLIRTVLEPLSEPGSELRPAIESQRMVIVFRRRGVSLVKKSIELRHIERLLLLGFIRRRAFPSEYCVITTEGEMAVFRFRKALSVHNDASFEHERDPTEGCPRIINRRESPLSWLARRRGTDGQPFIDRHQFAAGDRFRRDFTIAGLSPRMTVDWSRFGSGETSGIGHPGLANDAMIAARQRLHAALDVLGPSLSSLTLDLCCFLKGIADVELERGLKQRSAKKMLSEALTRLVKHYGIGPENGSQARAIRIWAEPE